MMLLWNFIQNTKACIHILLPCKKKTKFKNRIITVSGWKGIIIIIIIIIIIVIIMVHEYIWQYRWCWTPAIKIPGAGKK
jgi:hypothetical protein